MGLLIDGQWHDRWYDTGSPAAGSCAALRSSATG